MGRETPNSNRKSGSHLGDLSINGTTILIYTLKMLGLWNVNWIHLANDEVSVSGSSYTTVNPQVP
jgi:hypothetical protein